MRAHRLTAGLALLALAAQAAVAQQAAKPDSALLNSLRWRAIGPANMSGRITDIEGLPSPSRTFYVAAAAGGIWKTTNGGVTFRPIFDDQRVISMGDIAIAPSDTLQLWAGTGEEDSRNSISPGGGIYKSTDGGKSWRLMGLEKTEQIARIVVHPTNPDIVYVAAIGAVWRSNPERGLYKTIDGGRSWQLIKFVSDKAGFIDLVMHPTDPNTLYAASWERVRGPYFLESGGPGSALWKTTDGGATWTEVKGGGFPATMKGRIGLDISRSNPDVIYALVEAEPTDGRTNVGCRAAGAGGCGLYHSQDGGKTWEWMNGENTRPFYYSQVRVDPRDPNRVYWSSTPVKYSNDGGKTAGNTTIGLHVDHHAMWIDPNDPNHIVVGNDGGVGQTWDRGGNWAFLNVMPIGQFYNVSFDMATPYRVCGGLQDNGSWCGPSRSQGGITNADWFNVGGGDGFHTAQDPRDPNIIYSESQGGNMQRLNYATNERTRLQKPSWRDPYIQMEDSIAIELGDRPESRATGAQRTRIQELRRRQAADSAALDMRWNWNTPFFLSPHNPDVFYAGANRVLKSTNRGEDLRPISPDLTTRDTQAIRISTRTTGGVTPDVTGAETFSTIVSLSESPLREGLLFAGTDDGKVWTSPDGGKTWNDLTDRFNRLVPTGTYVSRIEPSRHEANTFYVTFDNHRRGDFMPYVFTTNDGGRTFRSIANNLPTGKPDFVHVIREDPVNRDLLFLGTDVGAYVSVDRGASWHRFMAGLPTVPVHDLQIHPRDRELIAGTHGRSIWIVDIAPLQIMGQKVLASEPVLFDVKMTNPYGSPPTGGGSNGQNYLSLPSPGAGAEIVYYSPGVSGSARNATIAILDSRGDTVATVNGGVTKGIQRATWNLRARQAARGPLSPAERRDSIAIEARVKVVADSLVASGMQRETVDRLFTQFRNAAQGGFGGFGGGFGGGGGSTMFVERPGETLPTSGQGGGGGGGRGFGGINVPGVSMDQLRDIRDAVNTLPSGRASLYTFGPGGGGFGFGGAQAAFVAPGEYTASLTIGGKTVTQRFRVPPHPDAE